MFSREFNKYCRNVRSFGANMANINNIAAHWLYGTPSWQLAQASKYGIVYNPPGH
jgi:hypothetical protein